MTQHASPGPDRSSPALVVSAANALVLGDYTTAIGWLRQMRSSFERDGPEKNARGVTLDLARALAAAALPL